MKMPGPITRPFFCADLSVIGPAPGADPRNLSDFAPWLLSVLSGNQFTLCDNVGVFLQLPAVFLFRMYFLSEWSDNISLSVFFSVIG